MISFTRWSYRLYFLLAALEAAAAAWALLRIPSGAGDSTVFAYSPARLVLLAVTMLLTLVSCGFFLRAWRKPAWLEQVHQGLKSSSVRCDLPFNAVLIGLSMAAAGVFFLTVTSGGRFPARQAVLERLQPLVLWTAAVGLQTALLVITLFSHPAQNNGQGRRRSAALGVAVVAFTAAFMAVSRWGLRPDNEWLHPNSPILASQVFLALCIVLILLLTLRRMAPLEEGKPHDSRPFWLDLALGLALWCAAFLVWNFTSLNPTFFNTTPVPPNYEFYPNSDAADYDRVAQYLLLGQGFGNHSLVIRPLYSFLLAIYRMLAGESYEKAIMIQTALLAFYPVAVFLLGRQLHSRLAGLLAAVLVILRERNAIALGGVIPGGHSHLKLFMTDIPSAAGVAVLALLVVLWLQAPEKRRWLALLSGGLLGALMLIRTQSSVLLIAVVLSAMVVLLRRPKALLSSLALFAIGYAAFLAPWMLRNYRLSGAWVLEMTPSFFLGGEVRYITGQTDTTLLPGESGPEYDLRMQTILRKYILAHPLEVVDYAGDHFFHNELNTALILPLKPDALDLKSYVTGYDFWFGTPALDLTPLEAASLGLNVALAGVGLGAAFGTGRREALLPLLMHMGYNASTALARRSGGRYFLPGDWIGLFFFAIGLAQVIFWLAGRVGSERLQHSVLMTDSGQSTAGRDVPNRRGWSQAGLTLAIVFLLGASMPLAEKIIPVRYPQRDKEQVMVALLDRWNGVGSHAQDLERLQTLAQNPNIKMLWGRGLSPRYFLAGEGIRSREALMDLDRLRFEHLGQSTNQVILPLDEPPVYFPSGADVIVVGCQAEGYLEAAAVIVLGQGEQPDWVYWRSPGIADCPAASP